MTIRFLQEFRARSTCSSCKRAPADGRKTCPTHLEKAKLQFRKWYQVRVAKGLCVNCDRRGYRGECRCLLHKGKNQMRCQVWVEKNKDWSAFKSAFERTFLKADGICVSCRRRPMVNERQCVVCRDRSNQQRRAA